MLIQSVLSQCRREIVQDACLLQECPGRSPRNGPAKTLCLVHMFLSNNEQLRLYPPITVLMSAVSSFLFHQTTSPCLFDPSNKHRNIFRAVIHEPYLPRQRENRDRRVDIAVV